MAWGNAIRAYREGHGLTQNDLATSLGVDQGTISRWERGRIDPSLNVKRMLVDKIIRFREEDPTLQQLIERIKRSERCVAITHPGIAKNMAASPAMARMMGVPQEIADDYDWEIGPMTQQQINLYGPVTNYLNMFEDRSIISVDVDFAKYLPNMTIVRVFITAVPRYDRIKLPRLLVHQHKTEFWDGQPGKLIVHRITEDDEVLMIPN